jgi:hypothetical protein
MKEIGEIVLLQVQRSSLKQGERNQRRYVPDPIVRVPELLITESGVVGLNGTGEIVDVHNLEHPESKNRGGENGISVGFTSHYVEMRQRFGSHLSDGIAGENLIVACDQRLYEDAFARGCTIVRADGKQIQLVDLIWAPPCVEFTRFALRFPEDQRPDLRVTEGLQTLSDGLRGFYARYAGEAKTIAVGDRVFIPL